MYVYMLYTYTHTHTHTHVHTHAGSWTEGGYSVSTSEGWGVEGGGGGEKKGEVHKAAD